MAKVTNESISYVSPKEVAKIVRDNVKAGINTWIHGGPGLGKTKIVQDVMLSLLGDGYNRLFIQHPSASSMESVDVRGVPAITDVGGHRRTTWCPPAELWNLNEDTVYFLDEFSQGDKSVIQAYSQIIWSKRCGGLKISDGSCFIATGNRPEDKAGVGKIMSHIANRFQHIGLAHSYEDWIEWAWKNEIAPEVISFIRWMPDQIYTFDPSKYQLAYSSPRSLEMLSNTVKSNSDESHMQHRAAGCIGSGSAGNFMTHWRLHASLPDPNLVLTKPEEAPVKMDAPVRFAYCAAVVSRCRKAKRTELTNVVKYASRIGHECGIYLIRDVLQVNSSIMTVPGAQPWLKENAPIIIES